MPPYDPNYDPILEGRRREAHRLAQEENNRSRVNLEAQRREKERQYFGNSGFGPADLYDNASASAAPMAQPVARVPEASVEDDYSWLSTPTGRETARKLALGTAGRFDQPQPEKPSPVEPSAWDGLSPEQKKMAISARPAPMRVVRDAKGNITSASNIDGAPGEVFETNTQGTVSSPGGQGGDAYLNYLANLEGWDPLQKATIRAKMREMAMSEQDPLWREKATAKVEADAYYGKERAKQTAEYDVRSQVLNQKSAIEAHADSMRAAIQASTDPRDTPEVKQKALADIDRRLELELQRLGIPPDAQWNRLG